MVYKEKKRQKNKSLAGKVTLATIIGTSIIGLVGLVVGLVIFVRTLIGENMRDFLYVSVTARAFIKDDAVVDEIIKEVMDIYGALTEEERAETGTEAYRRHFAGISQREDYQRLYDLLLRFRLLNAVDNIYLVVYDKENSSLVHIIDTDDFDELGFKTGEWEYIGEKDIEQFFTREEVPCYIHRSVDNKIVFSTGLLTYANASHEPVVISRGEEGFEFVRGQKKPAVGMRPKVGFLEQEITLLPGDKVFLYTDGVTDAQVRRGKFFGRQRLLETLRNLDKDSCKFVIESVRDSISSFTGDAEQFDDMTMLCLKYNGLEVNFMYELNDVVRIIAEGDKLFGHTGKVSSILNKETEKNIGVDIHFDAQDPKPRYYSEDELELVKEHIKEEDY